jgi:hypothetical protein
MLSYKQRKTGERARRSIIKCDLNQSKELRDMKTPHKNPFGFADYLENCKT